MLRSLFSGITGLRQHQTLMDVVSNNIANVNTVGYKSSSVVFEDTLSQLVRAASSPGNGVGGVNPAQVGLGVQLGAISMNFAQGVGAEHRPVHRPDDPGRRLLRAPATADTQEYTRAGAFSFDTTGMLVNPEGMRVQGWNAVNGVLNTNGAPGDIVLPASTLIPPQPSANVVLSGNIQPTTAIDTITLGQTVYDERRRRPPADHHARPATARATTRWTSRTPTTRTPQPSPRTGSGHASTPRARPR